MESTKRCTDCRFEKTLSDFYKSTSHAKGVMCYCKACFNRRAIKRWVQRKIDAVRYKGAQCQRCGLRLEDSHYSVFEFHHPDKSQKDWDWSKLRLRSVGAIQTELDKCVLLCANCHRVVHPEDFPDQPKSR